MTNLPLLRHANQTVWNSSAQSVQCSQSKSNGNLVFSWCFCNQISHSASPQVCFVSWEWASTKRNVSEKRERIVSAKRNPVCALVFRSTCSPWPASDPSHQLIHALDYQIKSLFTCFSITRLKVSLHAFSITRFKVCGAATLWPCLRCPWQVRLITEPHSVPIRTTLHPPHFDRQLCQPVKVTLRYVSVHRRKSLQHTHTLQAHVK